MTTTEITDARTSTASSSDGTENAYHSIGAGPGLVIVGGVLSARSDWATSSRFTSSISGPLLDEIAATIPAPRSQY